jgi:hypothetical protein
VLTGEHSFSFLPCKSNPDHTTFVQQEVFSGPFGWILGEGILARQIGMAEMTRKNWEEYNSDLQVWCEGGKVRDGK